MAKAETPPQVKISVVYSPGPRLVREWQLALPSGSTIAVALEVTGVANELSALKNGPAVVGIWGKKSSLSQVLLNGDRVEIYRGLRVDPKVARRERFNRQGAKRVGLFAKTRAGAKAGY